MGRKQSIPVHQTESLTLGQILQTLREEDDVDLLVETSLAYLTTKFNSYLTWMGLYDRLDHQLVGKGGVSPMGKNDFFKQRISLTPGDLLERVIIELQPIIVEDFHAEHHLGDWSQAVLLFNLQSGILFPLRYKNRCFGIAIIGSTRHIKTLKAAVQEELSMVLGGLATALYHIETEWQRQQIKSPSPSILKLLSEFRSLQSLDQYLESIVAEINQLIEPTRTNIYWYHQEGRYFWRRSSNSTTIPELTLNRSPSGISVQEFSEFYQALFLDQVVSIGVSHSSLSSQMTKALMQKMRVRSLLAAPIIFNHELFGFLVVEAKQPRIWKASDNKVLRSMAHLVSLIVPLSEMDETIEQIKQDQALTAEVTRAITTDQDWHITLKTTAEQLCQRLNVRYFLVLRYQPDAHQFEVIYYHQFSHQRVMISALNALTRQNWSRLQKTGLISIENWDETSTFRRWREPLQKIGIRSLLVCSTQLRATEFQIQHSDFRMPSHSVLLIGHDAPRTWTQLDQKLVKVVSQQLSLIVYQWHLNHQIQLQHRLVNGIKAGWEIAQKISDLNQLEQSFIEKIAEALNSPLVMLMTWTETEKVAKITARAGEQSPDVLSEQIEVSVENDPLIQEILATTDVFYQKVQDLDPLSRDWLNSSDDLRQFWGLALRTSAEHQSTGIILIADPNHLEREPELSIHLLRLLATQLAWLRRYFRVQEILQIQREELQWLNWYKQRRIEELYRIVGSRVKQLNELNGLPFQIIEEHQEKLTNLRYQQLLRQISNALSSTSSLLQQEEWQLQNRQDLIVVSNLIRRLRDRLNPVIKNRQVALQVYQEDNLSFVGDSLKLELVLYELLLMACYRAKRDGMIKLKVRSLGQQQLELIMTDPGRINPQILIDLQERQSLDMLTPSTLDQPPGQHLIICQRVIQQMGGRFQIKQFNQKSNQNKIVTRLILPRTTP